MRRLLFVTPPIGDPPLGGRAQLSDLHRRAVVGVAVVSGQPSVVGHVLDECERIVAGAVDCHLLSVRRRMVSIDDPATDRA